MTGQIRFLEDLEDIKLFLRFQTCELVLKVVRDVV
jgi:hypothetical protein